MIGKVINESESGLVYKELIVSEVTEEILQLIKREDNPIMMAVTVNPLGGYNLNWATKKVILN